MSIATGTVTATSMQSVTVAVDRNIGCSPCAGGTGCGLGPVLSMFSRRDRVVRLPVPPDLELSVGDRIRFHARTDRVVALVLAGYGWPLAGIMSGAALVHLAAPAAGDAATVVGALLGLGGAGLLTRFARNGDGVADLVGSISRLPG
jgi:positive regulator of sigma E activity